MVELYILLAVLLGACAAFLVVHCEYEDGVLGRLALGALAIVEGLIVWQWWNGITFNLYPEAWCEHLFVTLFMARHVYRFVRFRRSGEHSWRVARK